MDEKTVSALKARNQKIIEAVLAKAGRDCPASLALIGVYGSFCTGDIHERSDLDLLIVINDPAGWQLGRAFVQGEIGHDIYCTTWEALEEDARCESAQIAKLMDAAIVYCADEKYRVRLEELRQKARAILEAPFAAADVEKVERAWNAALNHYARLAMATELASCRYGLMGALYELENALCLANKTYYRLGVRRVFQEIEKMARKPAHFAALCREAVLAQSVEELKERAARLMRAVEAWLDELRASVAPEKKAPTADELRGSYEEMISNWRNKMVLAAEQGDAHLALMTAGSLQFLLDEMHASFDMLRYEVLRGFDPGDLWAAAAAFDRALEEYLREYARAGLSVARYDTMDAFVEGYLG